MAAFLVLLYCLFINVTPLQAKLYFFLKKINTATGTFIRLMHQG